jgi:hypothetical protein
MIYRRTDYQLNFKSKLLFDLISPFSRVSAEINPAPNASALFAVGTSRSQDQNEIPSQSQKGPLGEDLKDSKGLMEVQQIGNKFFPESLRELIFFVFVPKPVFHGGFNLSSLRP